MPEPRPHEEDQRVLIHGVSWEQYESLREATDHVAGLHVTYLEGTLEIMSPSSRHELVKKLLARLLEAWAEERDVPLTGYGSTTYRHVMLARALEPDECYVIGDPKEIPDLAIEVVVSRSGIDKLAVYQGLGVREVWFWVDGRISIYQLASDEYHETPRSALLPEIDPLELAGTIAAAGSFDQTQVVKAFRQRIRHRGD